MDKTQPRREVTAGLKILLTGLFLLTTAGAAPATPASSPAAGPVPAIETAKTVVFFGDSITAGYGLNDVKDPAYPALIQKKIDAAGLPWRVSNAGLSGETSAGGLRRVDWILRRRADVFVLALGANDGLRGLPTDAMAENLSGILAKVRAKYPEAKLVLAGMRMPPSMGDYAKRFDAVFAEVAKKNGATYVPFLLRDVAGVPEMNQDDAIHPSPAGHRRIAETLWPAIEGVIKSGEKAPATNPEKERPAK